MKKIYMDGWVCGEPQEKSTSNGWMLTFGFNSPDNKKVDGKWESKAQFFDCKYFYKSADDAAARKIMSKDGKFLIAGTPHYDEWEKDGQKRSRISVTVDTAACIPSSTPAMEDAAVYSDEVPF